MNLTVRFKPNTQLFLTTNEYKIIGEVEIRLECGRVLCREVVSRSVFEEIKRVVAFYNRVGLLSGKHTEVGDLPKMSREARLILEGLASPK
jgi:hypothetical protein